MGRDFLYWEQMGNIDDELYRNLVACSLVIMAVVVVLIPRPKIAGLAIATVVMAIFQVVGYCHYIGQTISSVLSIYLLISVGITVDYSAHIAHFFKESTGSSVERAHAALSRIGPCVFHAVVTLFLACLALAPSKSFVFRTLFEVFSLTVLFGGTFGLCLLPVLLALFGGDEVHEDQKPDQVSPTQQHVPDEKPTQTA